MNMPDTENFRTAIAAEVFSQQDDDRSRAAHKAAEKELARMVEAQEVNILTDEEERMVQSLRRFKATCKPGAVFKWQTRPVEGVTIHPGNAPVMVYDPQEVA